MDIVRSPESKDILDKRQIKERDDLVQDTRTLWYDIKM